MFRFLASLFPPTEHVVVIVGPTASGKTSFSIELACALSSRGLDAEVISADSRQIYREIPIVSAAVTPEETQGVPHHLVGTESLEEMRSASWFRKKACELIHKIHERQRIPIVVGGSGFWISSLLCEDTYPQVAPNPVLRKELEQLSVEALGAKLARLDPKRFLEIDAHNPRRLIRAIEIAHALGKVPVRKYRLNRRYRWHLIYLDYPQDIHNERINKAVEERFCRGVKQEVASLVSHVPEEVVRELGLSLTSYHRFRSGEITEHEWQEQTVVEDQQYAKRQRTFFKGLWKQCPANLMHVHNQQELGEVQETLVAKLTRTIR